MKRMDVKRRIVLSCGLILGCSALFIGLAGAESVEGDSAAFASDVKALTEGLREDVSTLKVLLSRIENSLEAASGETSEDMRSQYRSLEGCANDIEMEVSRLEELSGDPVTNKEEMKNLVVNGLFLNIQKLGEANVGMEELVDKSLATFVSEEDEKKTQESVGELFEAKELAFQHAGALGEKLQDPIVWEYKESLGALNPNRLDNGNTLIAEVITNRVIEVNADKEVVWEYTDIDMPIDVERQENGNTLIADRFGHRVIEVTPEKEVVWEYKDDSLQEIFSVQRLGNGNTLIADQGNPSRVIEVSPDKEVVWEYGGGEKELRWPSLGQRLDDGNTLIADNSGLLKNSSCRVFEVAADKEITWQYDEGLLGVYTLQRLENGNTLICDQFNDRVIEVNPAKEIVWTYGAIDEPGGVQRLDNGNTLIGVFAENRVIEVAAA